MNFNEHSDLIGQHAFLGGSRYHWVNYDEEKLILTYKKYLAVQRGVELHDLAKRLIEQRVKLPKIKKAFNLYVNDAIGFRMTPELVLFYSNNAYGTADTISFYDGFLRIHDLKTGITPVSMHQLEIYSSLFCLEYGFNPVDINIELRIYQTDNEIAKYIPLAENVKTIMDKIIIFDKKIDKMKKEEQGHV